MRQWRVGTFSMGLVLICSGLGLLYGHFNKLAVLDTALKWWPIILILLGIEVLVQTALRKDENSKIKYDIFSIFIIMVIVFTGIGLQTADEIGAINYARNMINSQVYTLDTSNEISLDTQIKKIVIETGGTEVDLYSSTNKSILARSTLHVRAKTKPQAQKMVDQHRQFIQQQAGDTLYIRLNTGIDTNTVSASHFALVLPDYLDIKVEMEGTSLNANLDSIQNNWEINGPGTCQVRLPSQADLSINALLNNQTPIQGNLQWTKSTINPQTNNESNMDENIQAQAIIGNGHYKMNITDVQNSLTVIHLQ